jgi:hypothetical protein
MLYDPEQNGRLKGVKICKDAPSISHLLFAEDSLLLMEVNASNAQEVNRILEIYESCSGQMINKENSSIVHSKNMKPWQKDEVRQTLHILP